MVTSSPGPGRVLIALSDGPLVPEPTWTRFDMLGSDTRCFGYECDTGRQSELDTTETGNATVFFHDRVAYLESIGDDLVGKQIMLQLFNPVTQTWHIRWRGRIKDVDHDLVDGPPDLPLANVGLICVGIFDYLGGCKFIPGVMGDVAPAGYDAVVFYEDERVDDRCIALLDDARIDTSMRVTFTGNVDVCETLYEASDCILMGLRDAADAEMPGVANVYEDRFGRVVFHGRQARFDPEGTADGANWIFNRWYAATRGDVTTGVAQIRAFGYNRPLERLINTATIFPRTDEEGTEFDRSQLPDMIKKDDLSIDEFGYCGYDATDIIVKRDFNNHETSRQQCERYANFYVRNYAQPRKAVKNVTFMSHRPDDPRAAATWALMCQMDISDGLNLTVSEADLSNVPFFVDGVSVECRVLNQDYDIVTVTPNLTPASYYGTDVFSE